MAYSTIRASIKTALEAVAGISGGDGVVQDHEPHVTRDEIYLTTFGNAAGTLINGWTISRERKLSIQQDPGYRFRILHDIIVRGRRAVLTEPAESETVFQDLIDAVELAIRGSVAIWVEHPEESDQAIQTEIIEPEMHGSHLVQMCEMRFAVEEFETIAA